jgi:hypothetical protein
MVDPAKIKEIFDHYFRCTDPIVINSDGTISTKGHVTLMKMILKLPLEFYEVDEFDVGTAGLTTLAGSPKHVYGEFRCVQNNLKSLEGGPYSVGGDYMCAFNQLTNLKGAPNKIKGMFSCVGNPLQSLEGLPQEGVEKLSLSYSPNLPLLRALVAQEILFRQRVDAHEPPPLVQEIMTKYAGEGKRGAIRCQKELIAAGFEGNARW